MGRGAMYPQIICPADACRRPTRVAPTSETIYPHNLPNGEPCPSGGQRVDVYGIDPTMNGGDR